MWRACSWTRLIPLPASTPPGRTLPCLPYKMHRQQQVHTTSGDSMPRRSSVLLTGSKLRMKAVSAPVPDATRIGPCQRLIRRYLQCTRSGQTARSHEKSKGTRRSLAAGLALVHALALICAPQHTAISPCLVILRQPGLGSACPARTPRHPCASQPLVRVCDRRLHCTRACTQDAIMTGVG